VVCPRAPRRRERRRTMKRCTTCGISKKTSAFGYQKDYKSKNLKVRTSCKACRTEDQKKRYQTRTPEQIEAARDRDLRRLYGIGLDDYNRLFLYQEGRCPGCGKHQSELEKALSVDHRHSDGAVRGLLCSGCNLAIGNVKENSETLMNLASYIKRTNQ
jgi:hypothetical protein